jgi:hypothetical protein
MPLRRRVAAWCAACVDDGTHPRKSVDGDLHAVLARVSTRCAARARSRGMRFELEVDPALVRHLAGPLDALEHVLCLLLERAVEHGSPRVALQVDVVGDDVAGQLVHFTVVDDHRPGETHCARLRDAATIVAAVGGVVHTERGADIGDRIIVELAFDLPHTPPSIDVEALRTTLGGEAALREVMAALDRALCSDLADLDVLLARPGVEQLQAWLHRVSGALGMAEASELARVGLALERELQKGRRPHLDRAVRRFAEDAARVLDVLREQVPSIGYSPRS